MRFQRYLWIGLMSVVLLALSSAGLSSYASAPADLPPTPLRTPGPSGSSDGSATLALVENTVIPWRDRVDLAKRLLGVTNIPEPPTTPPPELEVGTVVPFQAQNLQEDYGFTVNATLLYKTPHVYMFVEQGQSVDQDELKKSAETFESVVYPKVHEVFGSEWTPGIDGDPHLYILHSTRLGNYAAAYFGSESEYPSVVVKNSNQHEMFYVNLDNMSYYVGSEYYESVLTHEFQHMVHWKIDGNEDTWINEGLSELAPLIVGYGVSDTASYFLSAPNIQLNTWPEDEAARYGHYGASYMFMAYFYQRYGEQATSTLVRDPMNGLESVQNTLTAIGAIDPTTRQPVTLTDLYADWLVTNLLLDPSVGDGRYAYSLGELDSLTPATITQEITANGRPIELAAPQWGPDYLQVTGVQGSQKVRLSFKGSDTVSVVPTDAHSGSFMWWSNRADLSDSFLTRAFDLTGVSSATLNFWTWYYIEDHWDYGYVMVSTDGGVTWTPFTTGRTTSDDPHGNAYGPGYTGQSQGWVEESIDLTPYAGQQILLRFEYITDDAVTQPGLIIDDVSIPEIGYADDFENSDGS